jgi:hypothetical protein
MRKATASTFGAAAKAQIFRLRPEDTWQAARHRRGTAYHISSFFLGMAIRNL